MEIARDWGDTESLNNSCVCTQWKANMCSAKSATGINFLLNCCWHSRIVNHLLGSILPFSLPISDIASFDFRFWKPQKKSGNKAFPWICNARYGDLRILMKKEILHKYQRVNNNKNQKHSDKWHIDIRREIKQLRLLYWYLTRNENRIEFVDL